MESEKYILAIQIWVISMPALGVLIGYIVFRAIMALNALTAKEAVSNLLYSPTNILISQILIWISIGGCALLIIIMTYANYLLVNGVEHLLEMRINPQSSLLMN